MLDRELIRKNPDLVRSGMKRKRLDSALVDQFLQVDAEFRRIATETGNAQAEANRIAKSIGQLMGQGKRDEAEDAKKNAAELKAKVAELEVAEREIEAKLKTRLLESGVTSHPLILIHKLTGILQKSIR